MKNKLKFIDGLYNDLSTNPDVLSLLGKFTDTNGSNPTLALAFDDVKDYQRLPTLDSCFIVYNLESSAAMKSETKTVLERIILKFFIKGYKAPELVEVLIGQLNGSLLYNYKCDYLGQTDSPDHTTILRFSVI
ncbi:hypothetical protein Q0M94_19200 (plasmid) [Deinococcus radiomollis]|uniref:hypothetical protein n=1 Tax=Deinococcus radiomollis TaxID=468916 RepID=UPI00389120B9